MDSFFEVCKLRPDAIIPIKKYEGDAGFDLFIPEKDVITINPGKWVKIPLGLSISISPGTVALVMEKSGLAVNHGLFSIAGVIDQGYRGEIHAVMVNLCQFQTISLFGGDKVAQLLIMPCLTTRSVIEITREKYNLTYTSDKWRGTGGFGSTGNSIKDHKEP